LAKVPGGSYSLTSDKLILLRGKNMPATNKDVLAYQQRCFRDYSNSIQLPNPYTFPDGNPIRSLPPIQTAQGGLMIIGAYPSARFESRPSRSNPGHYRLVPIANNLQPFGLEQYFDGIRMRTLESADGLQKYFLNDLSRSLDQCWITDLVKVFLYKPEHAESIAEVHPDFQVPVNRHQFKDLAVKSLQWLHDEVQLCNPKLIVTLGEEVAQVISGEKSASADDLLSRDISRSAEMVGYPVLFLPHPDACRRFEKWRLVMQKRIELIKKVTNP